MNDSLVRHISEYDGFWQGRIWGFYLPVYAGYMTLSLKLGVENELSGERLHLSRKSLTETLPPSFVPPPRL